MRLEITRRADLAIRAFAVLGRHTGRVKASELAESLTTTVAFVPQIVGPLVKAGWVRSDPGPTGGYHAVVALEDVNVLQVIEAVDGVTDGGRCVVADRACQSADPCALHLAWGRARKELLQVLESTSMAAAGSVSL
jgi:Rrf2 family protein